MAKLKIKINDNTSTQEIENIINSLLELNVNEINFRDLRKIAEAIGSKYLEKSKRGRGSQERFYNSYLKNNSRYPDCIFGIHVKPAGKKKFKVTKRDFKHYFVPALKHIIAIRKSKGE